MAEMLPRLLRDPSTQNRTVFPLKTGWVPHRIRGTHSMTTTGRLPGMKACCLVSVIPVSVVALLVEGAAPEHGAIRCAAVVVGSRRYL